jgi:hypothetical protein
MSNPIEQFVQLANSTFPAQGPAYVRGDELPWTGARQQDFAMLSMFLEGRDNLDFFSSGTDITTLFDGEIANTQFGPKRMADDHRRPAGGTMNKMSTPFTEYEWGQEITWHEINLQGDSIFSDSNSQRFYSILKKRNKDFTLDALKKMEKALGATPSVSMFTDAGTGMLDLKSLWTFCNVWEDRHYGLTASGFTKENLFPQGAANPDTPVSSTVQGLNPGDFAREDSYGKEYAYGGSQLAPTKVDYVGGAAGDPSDPKVNNILDQMQYMLDLLDWKPVPLAGEFAEGLQLEPKAILCTREAKRYFQRVNRAHGELFATIAPIGNPSQGSVARYGAIPLMTADTLRDAKLYPDVSVSEATAAERDPVTERDANGIVGGYYYFLDPRTVNLFFHSNRGWEQDAWESMAPINKDVMFRLGRFLGNVHWERFITNGILKPSEDIPNYV